MMLWLTSLIKVFCWRWMPLSFCLLVPLSCLVWDGKICRCKGCLSLPHGDNINSRTKDAGSTIPSLFWPSLLCCSGWHVKKQEAHLVQMQFTLTQEELFLAIPLVLCSPLLQGRKKRDHLRNMVEVARVEKGGERESSGGHAYDLAFCQKWHPISLPNPHPHPWVCTYATRILAFTLASLDALRQVA